MPPLAPARLNVFQRLARTWERAHPYNAAQIIRVRIPIDMANARNAWPNTLRSLGLGRVHASAKTYAHHLLNGEMERYPARLLDPAASLSDFLSDELNRSFDDPTEPPFRAFLQNDGELWCLGIVYQHWVADSVSIRLLLQEWLTQIEDPRGARATPPAHDNAGYWDLLTRQGRGAELGGLVLHALRTHMRLRRVRKPRPTVKSDGAVRVLLRAAEPGLIDRLRSQCRARALRVSDVFLAALAEACNAHVPMQNRSNRRGVAVGNVIDLRPHGAPPIARDTFGVYLGFISVTCPPSKLRDFSRLTQHIHRQIQAQRHVGIPQASVAWMGVADVLAQRLSSTRIDQFFRKSAPLAAGLSNVVLEGDWPRDEYPSRVVEFLRVSPTGPIAPLVLSTTTLGRTLQLALTFRTALLDNERATAVLDRVMARLTDFTQGNFSSLPTLTSAPECQR